MDIGKASFAPYVFMFPECPVPKKQDVEREKMTKEDAVDYLKLLRSDIQKGLLYDSQNPYIDPWLYQHWCELYVQAIDAVLDEKPQSTS